MKVSSVINMLNHTVSEQLELNYLRVFDSLLAGSLMTLLCDSVAKKKKKNRIRKIKIESYSKKGSTTNTQYHSC